MISDELVVDDPLGLLVPQCRHRDLAGVSLVGRRIRLVQVMETVHRVGGTVRIPGIVLERPAVLLQARNCVGDRDQTVELLERAIDQGAVRPWAAVRDVEVIAIGLSFEPGRPIGRNAVAKSAIGTAELSAAAGLLRELLVAPNPLDQDTHSSPPICRRQPKRK